jgi:hypothetical protein
MLCVAFLSLPALASTPPPVGIELMRSIGIVENISARAAIDANSAVLDAAARLRLSIQALQHSGQDILDKRPDDLTAAQRKTLEGIQSGVAALQAAAAEPADQARELLDEAAQRASDLAPAPGQPVVVRSSPSILVPPVGNESVIALTGRRLLKADPRLFFGDVEARRTELTEEEAVFVLPAGVLRGSDRTPLPYSGSVLVSDRDCSWLIRCRAVSYAYTVGVVVLPIRLATVRIGFNQKKTEKIYDPVSEAGGGSASTQEVLYRRRFEYSTDDLTVMSCIRESQAPHTEGHSIDTGTLSANVTERSGETRWSIVDASASGFSIELCAQPQIDRMGKTTGSVAVEAAWKEFRMGEVISQREWLEPDALNWGAQIKESLPVDTDEIEVELDYFDGSHASFSQTSSDRYVELKWDAQTRQLILTPRLRSSLADFR